LKSEPIPIENGKDEEKPLKPDQSEKAPANDESTCPEEKIPPLFLEGPKTRGFGLFKNLYGDFISSDIVKKLVSEKLYDRIINSKKHFEITKILSPLCLDEVPFIEILDSIEGELFQVKEYVVILNNSSTIEAVYRTGNVNEMSAFVSVHSDSIEKVKETLDKIENLFSKYIGTADVYCDLNWIILGRQREIESRHVREKLDDKIYEEAYPYIKLNEMIDVYLKNDEPILILSGPPGTGKTRLIRYVLKRIAETRLRKRDGFYSCSTLYSCHPEVIEHGSIFVNFLTSDYEALVLEDIDNHLKPRGDGNNTMYNLLSASNGLIVSPMVDKKIILSTNLPNAGKIDEALKRPGRCHKIVNSRKLSKEESKKFLEASGNKDLVSKLSEDEFALSDLYHLIKYKTTDNPQTKSAGFI
jgi:hypothetical protein